MARLPLALCGLLLVVASWAANAQEAPFLGIKLLNNGNVGVGTPTPEAPLHVNGDALITGRISGRDPSGQYGSAAVINGVSDTNGAAVPFVIIYRDDEANGPSIKFLNTQDGVFKSFIIAHPTDRERYLVHAALEGPEGAVYYRGSARLEGGKAEIVLPSYFEAATRAEGRTVQLTNVGGFDQLAVALKDGATVRNGRFSVVSNNPASRQAFDWEVKAVRADGPPLAAEPRRDEIDVAGFGPYTFITGRR